MTNNLISRKKVCDYISEFINHEYSTQSEREMVDLMIKGIQHMESVEPLNKLRAELYDYITHSPYIKSFMDCCRLRDDVMRIVDNYKEDLKDEMQEGL